MPIQGYAAKSAKAQVEQYSYEPGTLDPHEVEIRVTHCGICHSDLAMIDNDWGMSAYPLVPGHEVIGEVTALGSNVTGVRVGQRAGIGWQCGSCGVCEWCATARQQLCPDERATIIHHHGGWATRVRAAAPFIIPIPDAIDSASAAPLMCAGTTVFSPLLHYNVRPGMRAAVLGIGGLGHLAVQFLAKFGCEVTAISSTHDKDEEARQFGARRFIATRGTDELKQVANSFDFIMTTVAVDMPWTDYADALRPQGTLCFVGVPVSSLGVHPFSIIGKEKRIVGGRTGSPADTRAMLEFAASHDVRPKIQKFPMAQAVQAVEHVRANKARYRVVLVA